MINKKSEKTVCSEQRLLATDSQFNARKSGALRSSLSKSGAIKRQQVESIESNIFNFAPRSKTCGVKNFDRRSRSYVPFAFCVGATN